MINDLRLGAAALFGRISIVWAALPEARDSGDTDADKSPKARSAVCMMYH